MRAPRARGFTLVELMIVVSIIGLLASTAIPTFLAFSHRAKRTERNTLAMRIAADMKDYILRSGDCPHGGAPLEYNPPATPLSGTKKRWDAKAAGWSQLDFLPEGFLYYHYRVECFPAAKGLPGFRVTSVSDLDGDAVPAYRWDTWEPGVDTWHLADTTYFPDTRDNEY